MGPCGEQEGECIYYEKSGVPDEGGHVRIVDFTKWPADKLEDFMIYAWQIDEEHYSGYGSVTEAQQDTSSYINHSCTPNVWWSSRTDSKLVTRRPIKAGEQLLMDYATVESVFFSERGPQSGCLCMSPLCRGRIKGDDYLDPVLIERYGDHWMGYLLNRRGLTKPYDDNDPPHWLTSSSSSSQQ